MRFISHRTTQNEYFPCNFWLFFVCNQKFLYYLAGGLAGGWVCGAQKTHKIYANKFLISLRLVLQIEKQNTRNYMWLDVVHTVYSLSINNLGGKLE